MLRTELKAYIDEASEEEVQALAILLGLTEDLEAAMSPSLQAELAAARTGEGETVPIEEVARRLGVEDV